MAFDYGFDVLAGLALEVPIDFVATLSLWQDMGWMDSRSPMSSSLGTAVAQSNRAHPIRTVVAAPALPRTAPAVQLPDAHPTLMAAFRLPCDAVATNGHGGFNLVLMVPPNMDVRSYAYVFLIESAGSGSHLRLQSFHHSRLKSSMRSKSLVRRRWLHVAWSLPTVIHD